MKFRNPWVDPRVEKVTPSAARAYLTRNGWKPSPASDAELLPFVRAEGGDDPQVLILPLRVTGGADVQRMIELIGGLALSEGRYAVEVLNDILDSDPETGNGRRNEARSVSSKP